MPLLYAHTSPLRGVWKITESCTELLSQVAEPGAYADQLASFASEHRKQEWIAVRLLTNILLGDNATIAYKENGAPYLPERKLNISISHTKGYAAVLLQEKPFVGIDIERISSRILQVQDRVLSSAEKEMISDDHTTEHLLTCWCAKEVLFKMIPEDTIDFREHLHIEPFPYSRSGDIQVYESKSAELRRFTLSFEVSDDFVCVWSL